MIATPPTPSPSLKLFSAAAKGLLWLLLAAWLVLALAWGALHAFIVPRIAELRPALEREASRALGVPVRIGRIDAQSAGWLPSFELRDVVLLDPQGQVALRLPLVKAAVSPRSALGLGFEQLYVEGAELSVRRTADGRILVAGLDFSRASDNEGRAADWFFSQPDFVLRGGTLHWLDERRDAPPLALREVDLVARNGARRHGLRIEATPPASWGERFRLTGVFRQPLLTASPGRWQAWSGQLHADFSAVDVAQLRHYLPAGSAVQVAAGRGRLRAWADVHRGQLAGGTADLLLHDVQATLRAGLQPLALASVSGRVAARRLGNGFQLEGRGLQFETAAGERWPLSQVALTWTGNEGQRAARGELRASRLDLGALGSVASRLPLGHATHAALAAHAPQGTVHDLLARWQGPLDAPLAYEARGRASGLALAARPQQDDAAGWPGVRGAALDFDFTQAGGRARLAIEDGALAFPGVFEQPVLPVDTLSADVRWQLEGEAVAITVAELAFSNADARGKARAHWRTGDPALGAARFPGELELDATLERANGARVWRYLPLAVPKQARDYVRAAVQTGTATDAVFRVRGPLAAFPFADGRSGEFRITAPVRDVHLAYVTPRQQPAGNPWPALTGLSARLVFQGSGMRIEGATGRIAGAPRLLVGADAQIPDFEHTEVAVQGRIRGPLAEALAVVNHSPVTDLLSGALARATATGSAEVELKLQLPVHALENARVQGAVLLAGNDVQVTPDSPLLARARGAVQFSDKGFQLAGVQARALGGELRLDGGTQPALPGGRVPVVLRAQGVATAEGLRQAGELGFVSRLARDFSGSAGYQLALAFRGAVPEVVVTSNLQGLAVQLPAPLGKPADSALPLRYETALTPESLQPGAQRLQETFSLELGRLASVQYLQDITSGVPRVLRGRIGVGLSADESVPMPVEGVFANVQLESLDIDAWQGAFERLAGGAAASPAGQEPTAGAQLPATAGYLPTVLALRAGELAFDGRKLHDVVVGGARDGTTWRGNVHARQLSGYLEYRQPAATGAGRLHARLARLNIEAAAASQVEALLEEQPTSIPALDVVVEDFELKGRKLGRLEIAATNTAAAVPVRDAGPREWRLDRLRLKMPEATFSATGNWAAIDPGRSAAGARRTAMQFELDIANAGGLLARFGMRELVRAGRGQMRGAVTWAGSPLALDYASLDGQLHLDIGGGQFLKAEPGMAKLLGVLSLQSLPRRLALDFRDVFTEGFAFDFVRGDVRIDDGVAATNNLQMKGVNAAVLMEGRADLARETQSLKVLVVPEINAGTASLVAAVINPAVGIGSFLAQLFLREPLMRAATQEFQVEGTWADPRVTRVARAPTVNSAGAAASPGR